MIKLINKVAPHLSSISIVIILAAVYGLNHQALLDSFVPPDLRGFFLFIVVCFVVLFERINTLSRTQKVNDLKNSVDALYNEFKRSGDDHITLDTTIRALAILKDTRRELGVNSYTQERLKFMCSKIRRI